MSSTATARAAVARLVVVAGLLATPLAALPPAGSIQTGDWEWAGVGRVVAIGDLHGSKYKLVRLLAGAKLVDRDLQWTGGSSHLVVAGDFLDRGSDDRPLMDLLRRLEDESRQAGGRVHVLLGNHEVMNLMRDVRYVHPKSYRHFMAEETAALRRKALGRLAAGDAESRVERMKSFHRDYPRGYFGRLRSFDAEGEYGRWLLSLPVMVKINGVVYVHGGLTTEVAALGLDEVNRRVSEMLRRHLECRRELVEAGWVSPAMTYAELKQRAALAADAAELSQKTRAAAREFLATADSLVLGARGPLWYRGNSFEDERLERATVERALELLGAEAMVVAHTPTPGHRVTSRFRSQLYRIDHGPEGNGRLRALVAERGEILMLDSVTGETSRPLPELPPGSYREPALKTLPENELAAFLAASPVLKSRPVGRGSTRPRLLTLGVQGKKHRAIFKTVESKDRGDRFQHEVAAYRLDRALGLGLVPVTVLRTIDGQPGSLQAWVERAVDREAIDTYELGLCRTRVSTRQMGRGEIFDALIGNPGRKSTDVLCLLNEEKLLFIDHSEAFPTSVTLPWADGKTLAIEPALARALEELDRQALTVELGELLDEAQIDALLARRDRILARAGVVADAR